MDGGTIFVLSIVAMGVLPILYAVLRLLGPHGQETWGHVVRNIDHVTTTLMHRLDRETARHYTEEEARRIFGNAEVDRFNLMCDAEDRADEERYSAMQ